jgi:hypothetical protein
MKAFTTKKKSSDREPVQVDNGDKGNDVPKEAGEVILKIPDLTWIYWGEKMTATTFGETFADSQV